MNNHFYCIYCILNNSVCDNLYNWIVTYLSNRKQSTRYNGKCSAYQTINAGVIQGSGLGPLLFSFIIADLKCIHDSNTLLKYADDCFLIIPSRNNNTVCDEGTWLLRKTISLLFM